MTISVFPNLDRSLHSALTEHTIKADEKCFRQILFSLTLLRVLLGPLRVLALGFQMFLFFLE